MTGPSTSPLEPKALDAYAIFRTRDVDEARWRLSSVFSPHELRDPAPAEFEVTAAEGDDA